LGDDTGGNSKALHNEERNVEVGGGRQVRRQNFGGLEGLIGDLLADG
jgi:hypothetical protein